MNRDKEIATKPQSRENVVDSFFEIMNKFSGCAGDGTLTASSREHG
jgi:hypothetical protein